MVEQDWLQARSLDGGGFRRPRQTEMRQTQSSSHWMRTAHRRGEGNTPLAAWTRGHGTVFERTGVVYSALRNMVRHY